MLIGDYLTTLNIGDIKYVVRRELVRFEIVGR
jgi:hypothetical protein